MKQKITAIFIFALFISTNAQRVVVDVNLNVSREVDTVTTFHREKFVTMHADVIEPEWDNNWGENAVGDLRKDFLDGYDVYLGRNTGPITGEINKTKQDSNRPGYADTADIKTRGQNYKVFCNKKSFTKYEWRNDLILCAQLHPFWPDGTKTSQTGWSFSQKDTQDEPFGTATGEYMAHFIRDYFGTDSTTGQAKPKLVEVINEPLWHISDFSKVFRYHSTVAKEIKKLHPEIKVGGYCTAFPNFEENDFQRWENRWKKFIDITGEDMDFWTIHLYDFPTFGGKELYRKGSNMEATMDMLEQYSFIKFGAPKELMVSEFGASVHDYQGKWSPYRDWLHIKSVNSMMMQFMERPQIINKVINFSIIKATWGYNANNGYTYPHRLMRRENEPESYTGDWVYTDNIKHFQLWEDVKGKRVDTKSDDPDLLCDTYVDGNEVYVILNNLDFINQNIQLNLKELEGNSIDSLEVKHLHLGTSHRVIDKNSTELDITKYTSDFPQYFSIAPEATIILRYSFKQAIDINESNKEKKYYANEYLKTIYASTTNTFNINGVEKGDYGEATLRLAIGRAHNASKGTITFNGTAIEIPDDYRGGTQTDRSSFYGVREIPIPYSLLQENNVIDVKFPDGGGKISTVTLQVNTFSHPIDRFNATALRETRKETAIKVFPNPAKDKLSIDSDETFAKAIIYNLQGRKVAALELTNTTIDISDLENGIYILKLINNTSEVNTKFSVSN